MEIKALRCPCSPGEPLPLDHYLADACTDPDRDPDWMWVIQSLLVGDSLHAAGNLTATRMTKCPRATIIGDFLPVTLNLGDYNDIYWGNAMHAMLERHGRPGMHKEVAFPFEGQEPPQIFGRSVRGRCDVVSPDTVLIKDYKFHGAWAQWFAAKDRDEGVVKPELRAQFSVYKIALEQCLPGTKITKALARHAAMGTGKGKRAPFDAPAWMAVEVPFMDEEEIGAMRPLGGTQTVLEGIALLEGALAEVRAIPAGATPEQRTEALEGIIRSMPMTGRERGWKNKSGFTPECDYCGCRWDCERIEGIPSYA